MMNIMNILSTIINDSNNIYGDGCKTETASTITSRSAKGKRDTFDTFLQ